MTSLHAPAPAVSPMPPLGARWIGRVNGRPGLSTFGCVNTGPTNNSRVPLDMVYMRVNRLALFHEWEGKIFELVFRGLFFMRYAKLYGR